MASRTRGEPLILVSFGGTYFGFRLPKDTRGKDFAVSLLSFGKGNSKFRLPRDTRIGGTSTSHPRDF